MSWKEGGGSSGYTYQEDHVYWCGFMMWKWCGHHKHMQDNICDYDKV